MGGSVSSGFVSGGCVGVVSGGFVGVVSGGVVGFVSSGCVVGVVGTSVACWGNWVSVGTISSVDPADLLPSVLFPDGSGTVDIGNVGSDVTGPDAIPSRSSVGSVWEDQSSEGSLR